MKSDPTTKRAAFAAATRRFPHSELSIRRLLESDENFRDICDELADADSALALVETGPALSRGTRRAEWQELIDRLIEEIAAALRTEASAGHSGK